MLYYFRHINTHQYLKRGLRNGITPVKSYIDATGFTHLDAKKFQDNIMSKKVRKLWEIIELTTAQADLKNQLNVEPKKKSIEEIVYEDTCKNKVETNIPKINNKTISKEKEIEDILTNMPDNLKYLEFESEIANNDSSRSLFKTLKPSQFNDLKFDWCTYLKEFDKFISDLNAYRYNLGVLKQIVHKKIVDLQHYIEFNNLAAPEGYKSYKSLQKQLQLRREIKNETDVVEIIFRDWVKDNKSINVIKSIEGRANRMYKPRCMTDLFDEDN